METEYQKKISDDEQTESNACKTQEENIKRIVKTYNKKNLTDHLLGLANNMRKIKIRN